MWAKLGAQLLIELLKLIPDLVSKIRKYFEEKKKRDARIEASKKVAQKVEDAKDPEDVRAAADDLP